MMYGYDYGNGSSGWMMVVGLVVTALVVALIAFVVIRAERRLNSSLRANGPTAQAILETRFARGEIDDTEFQRRSGLLSKV